MKEQHSRKKTGKALFVVAVALIPLITTLLEAFAKMAERYSASGFDRLTPLFLAGGVLLLIGTVLAYKNSGVGFYATGAVFSVVFCICHIVPNLSVFSAPLLAAAAELLGSLCLCAALWFTLKGTADVLRVSRLPELATRAGYMQMLALLHAVVCCVNFFAALTQTAVSFNDMYMFYIAPFVFLIVLVYLFEAGVNLTRVKELDPEKAEEIRSKLK